MPRWLAALVFVCVVSAPATAAAQFRLKTEQPETKRETWYDWLKLLGGVELAGFTGGAAVRSGVRPQTGDSFDVAAGFATQNGFRVSLWSAPKRTGFTFYPTGGYFSQQIDISDFYAQVPRVVDGVQDELPGSCFSADTGEYIDCEAPNVYTLDVQSIFAGARGGFDLVAGWDHVNLFAGVSGGVNAAEFRILDARLEDNSNRVSRFSIFRSWAAGAAAGVHFEKWHLGLRLLFDYQWYLRFAFGEPVEFKGPVEYDETDQRYFRRRMWVDDARFRAWNLQAAAAFVF